MRDRVARLGPRSTGRDTEHDAHLRRSARRRCWPARQERNQVFILDLIRNGADARSSSVTGPTPRLALALARGVPARCARRAWGPSPSTSAQERDIACLQEGLALPGRARPGLHGDRRRRSATVKTLHPARAGRRGPARFGCWPRAARSSIEAPFEGTSPLSSPHSCFPENVYEELNLSPGLLRGARSGSSRRVPLSRSPESVLATRRQSGSSSDRCQSSPARPKARSRPRAFDLSRRVRLRRRRRPRRTPSRD